MFIFQHSRAFLRCQGFAVFLCCHRLHISRCCIQKKKWNKNEVSSLLAWNYETDVIFGPRIDPKKAKSAVSTGKHKATHNVSHAHSSPVAVHVTANELKHSETELSDLPYSTTRRLSSQRVQHNSVEKQKTLALNNSFNSHTGNPAFNEKRQTEVTDSNVVSSHSVKDVAFVSTKRERTYEYTWIDGPVNIDNTITPVTRTNTDSDNEAQNVEQVRRMVTNASSDTPEMSHTHREQLVDNNSSTKVRTDEDTVQNNSSHQYILSFPLFGNNVLSYEAAGLPARLPSVSAILKATMPPENQLALTRWELRMIAELGKDGFKEYQKALFANGANLHTAIHHYMSGKPVEELVLLPANDGHWQSIESVLTDITDVVCLEKPVRHRHLQYCGVLDCIAEYRGEKHVIEWKTSKRRKSTIQETFDNPLQLVAYLGAYNVQPSTLLQVERCLLVIGYEDGSAANVHTMDKWDCLRYWSQWLQRLHQYQAGSQSPL